MTDDSDFLRAHHQAILATLRASGRPQLSRVLAVPDQSGHLRISTPSSTAKARNLRRDPRCTLLVLGDNPWHYRVVEGTARIEDSGDQLLDHLVEYYRAAAGEHPNWDEYRAAMVNEGRLLAWIHIDRILNPTGA